MKSNLRRKLFMSVAATAACAATLTSTTFAWYTQNDTVTTDSVNAVTESSIDTGSIYISAGSNYSAGAAAVLYTYDEYKGLEGNSAVTQQEFDALTDAQKTKTPAVAKKAAQTWSMYKSSATPVLVNGRSLTLTAPTPPATMATDGDQDATILTPVYFDGTSFVPMTGVTDKYTKCEANAKAPNSNIPTYYTLSGSTYSPVADVTAGSDVSSYYTKTAMGDVTYGSEAATNQMEFVYRLRTANAGVATNVYFKDFSIANTTAGTFPSQMALVSGQGTGITAAGSYSVDLLSALKMTIFVTNVTKDEGDSDKIAAASATATTYNFKAFASHNNNVDVVAVGETDATNKGNAIGYYNTALGTNISAPAGYTEGTKLLTSGSTQLSFQIPATGYVEIRFVFWLDGWDSYCYDTCRQQSFQFGTNFTTTPVAKNEGVDSYTTVYTA